MISLLKNTYYAEPCDCVDVVDVLKDAIGFRKPTFIRLKNAPPKVSRIWPADGSEP
jgi:hypothetical protein